MSNYFSTFDNPYAVMAQGAYPDGPKVFPFDALSDGSQRTLLSGHSVKFNFSTGKTYDGVTYPGGRHYSDNPSATIHPDWPQNGVVYLQPDPTLRSVTQTIDLPLPPLTFSYPSPTVTTNVSYQKGLLTDEPAGFNAYFSLDRNETIESQLAYFFMFDSRSCGILVL